MSLDIDSKVIGYFAYNSPTEVICEGDACVISGSEEAMHNYLKSMTTKSSTNVTIKNNSSGREGGGMPRSSRSRSGPDRCSPGR